MYVYVAFIGYRFDASLMFALTADVHLSLHLIGYRLIGRIHANVAIKSLQQLYAVNVQINILTYYSYARIVLFGFGNFNYIKDYFICTFPTNDMFDSI